MEALFVFLLVLAMAAAVGKITAPFVVKSLAAETRQEQIAVRTPTLQELFHDLVMEGRKDLPRKKIETPEAAIWLASILAEDRGRDGDLCVYRPRYSRDHRSPLYFATLELPNANDLNL